MVREHVPQRPCCPHPVSPSHFESFQRGAVAVPALAKSNQHATRPVPLLVITMAKCGAPGLLCAGETPQTNVLADAVVSPLAARSTARAASTNVQHGGACRGDKDPRIGASRGRRCAPPPPRSADRHPSNRCKLKAPIGVPQTCTIARIHKVPGPPQTLRTQPEACPLSASAGRVVDHKSMHMHATKCLTCS